jgi:hypothetical protein
MRLSRERLTVGWMMIIVGILGILFSLHTPVLRDAMRYGVLVVSPMSRSDPASVSREQHIFHFDTMPRLIYLGMCDLIFCLMCWRWRRIARKPR